MRAERAVAEHRFPAMGSDAHVIVVDGPAGLEREAERRIADLERRWTRFDDTSEVSALTRHAGSPVVVSPETRELVERAVAAWRLTGGRFEPTVLGALVRAGYDRSFDELDPPRSSPAAGPATASLSMDAGSIQIVADTVRLPAGTGFDAGGIGKGLAADIVADELRATGAAGVCINLGGDVRVEGASPTADAWTVSVDYPARRDTIAHVGIARGAVATSTTLRRQWRVDGELRHHIIDPRTGRPSNSDLTFVSVVAGHAWMAEVLAKAIIVRGSHRPFELLEGTGAEALAVDRDGRVSGSAAIEAYLAEPLPRHPRPGRAESAS